MTSMRLMSAMILCAAIPATAQTPPAREALEGVDPVVLLTQGKEVFGKPELKVERGRFAYLFTSPETKATFEQSPEKYEIQLGGLCAKMGGGATGNPADYAVVDGKIYVFGSDDCHKKFVAAPAKYLPPAPAPVPTDPGARQRGAALLDRVVAALGGAAAIDGVSSYVEQFTRVQTTPQGDVPAVTKMMWRFPGGARYERTVSLPDRTMSFGNLLTPEGVWGFNNRQPAMAPGIRESRPSFERLFGRSVVPLLRARRDSQFVVAAAGQGEMDGAAVDLVRVTAGAVDVTLGVDPGTALVRGMRFVDRGPGGEFGDYLLLLSDYRKVSNIQAPFSEKAFFNGAPDTLLTRTLDTVAINEPLDAALFTPRGR